MPRDPKTGRFITGVVSDIVGARASAAASAAANEGRTISVGGRVMPVAEAARLPKTNYIYTGLTPSISGPRTAAATSEAVAMARPTVYAPGYGGPSGPRGPANIPLYNSGPPPLPNTPNTRWGTSFFGGMAPPRSPMPRGSMFGATGGANFMPGQPPPLPPAGGGAPPNMGGGSGGGAGAGGGGRGILGTLGRSIGMTALHVGAAYGIFRIMEGLGEAAEKAKEYSGYLAKIESIGIATGQPYGRGGSVIMGTAVGYGQPMKESAHSIMQLLSRGISSEQLPGAMAAMGTLAQATGGSMGKLTGQATEIMHGFGMGHEGIGKISETLFRSSGRSGIDVEDMGEAIAEVGPLAHTAAMSMNELAGAFTIIGRSGPTIQSARFGMRTFLSMLASPSRGQQDLAGQFGMPFSMQALRAMGPGAFFAQIGKMPQQARTELLGNNSRLAAVMAPLMANPAAYQAEIDALNQGGSQASRGAWARRQSIIGRYELAQAGADAAQTAAGPALALLETGWQHARGAAYGAAAWGASFVDPEAYNSYRRSSDQTALGRLRSEASLMPQEEREATYQRAYGAFERMKRSAHGQTRRVGQSYEWRSLELDRAFREGGFRGVQREQQRWRNAGAPELPMSDADRRDMHLAVGIADAIENETNTPINRREGIATLGRRTLLESGIAAGEAQLAFLGPLGPRLLEEEQRHRINTRVNTSLGSGFSQAGNAFWGNMIAGNPISPVDAYARGNEFSQTMAPFMPGITDAETQRHQAALSGIYASGFPSYRVATPTEVAFGSAEPPIGMWQGTVGMNDLINQILSKMDQLIGVTTTGHSKVENVLKG